MRYVILLLAGVLTFAVPLPTRGEDAVTLTGRDTLDPQPDDSPEVQRCLDGLTWKPGEFDVTVHRQEEDGPHAFVRFPSAKPSGIARNDLVALEWYAPRNEEGAVAKAPAVVVVHESGSRMEVGRLFAKAIYAKGFHAFLIHLPHYGLRRTQEVNQKDGSRFLPTMKQAIADVRRARDAVAALPEVDARQIAVQGTSLGGFVTATTVGLDHGFDQAFIMLAGGDLLTVINGGRREAAQLRQMLADAGFEGEKLKELVMSFEPNRLAHRIDPQRVWLYTAKDDQVVPLASANSWQKAARIPDDQHILLWGDHYKVILYFPVIIDHMTARLRGD